MAAARAGQYDIRPDGSVIIAGQTLTPDEVEIQASPLPGTAVAHDDGLVVVIDTQLTPELRAEGDARELQRAIQDLRRDAGLELDDRIDLWLEGLPPSVARHVDEVAEEVLAASVTMQPPPADGIATTTVELGGGMVRLALRARLEENADPTDRGPKGR
jgi:isoleucyl-tRNA synthetase